MGMRFKKTPKVKCMVKKMNKDEFINELSKRTNYSKIDCTIINDVLENNFFLSKKNKDKIMGEIIVELDISIEEASNIYNIAKDIVSKQIKEKLKHPFKSQE